MEASSSRPRLRSNASKSSSHWGGVGKPPSPTMSATTQGSRLDFTHPPHLLITRADLRKSIGALQELMQSAKLLRQTLLQLSNHTSAFASALMDCARVKGCNTQNGGLMGAGGLEFLIGDGERLLADQVYRNFEIPLLETLDEYSSAVATRQAEYEKQCAEKTGAIRKMESENMRGGRRKKRDLQQFRKALGDLQAQVDELDYLKSNYHQEVMEAEDELWNKVGGRVGFMVKAQMDLYERVSSKSTDPSIEPLMSSDPDPFDSYGHQPPQEGQIFSVLSPLGLLQTPPKAPSTKFSRTPTMSNNLPTTSAVASGSATPIPPASDTLTGTTITDVEGVMGLAMPTGSGTIIGAEGSLARQLGEDMVTPSRPSRSEALAMDAETPVPRGIAFPSGGTPDQEGHLGELLFGDARQKALSTIEDEEEVGLDQEQDEVARMADEEPDTSPESEASTFGTEAGNAQDNSDPADVEQAEGESDPDDKPGRGSGGSLEKVDGLETSVDAAFVADV